MTLLWLQTAPTSVDPLPAINTPVMEYVEVLLVLAGVLALAHVTLRFGLPRFFGMRTPTDGPIQMIARYPLEPKKTLYLVKVGSEVFLIGTSEGKVEYLTGIAPENASAVLDASLHKERQVLNWVHKARKADC
jgi:flagellar biogenesis protein FliO